MWKRLMSVLLVVLLCCPIFAARAEKITADGRVNRALLVGCDRFLTQTDTTPSSRNNVLRMVDALSGGTLNMQTIVTREDGLPSSAALVAPHSRNIRRCGRGRRQLLLHQHPRAVEHRRERADDAPTLRR